MHTNKNEGKKMNSCPSTKRPKLLNLINKAGPKEKFSKMLNLRQT